jgi:predicted kinase
VLVLCGVSGTGKTTVAQEVAAVSGWEHLSSDVTRKRLSGLDPTERGGVELYSRARTIATYRELGNLAAQRLERGRGAVVDATFHLREERDAFRAGLGERPESLLFIECRASTETLLARVRERALQPDRISDADAAILEQQVAEFEPLDEVPEQWRAELRTEAQPPGLVAQVEAIADDSLLPPALHD